MIREAIKRSMPEFAREMVIKARAKLAPPPLEDIVLHGYEVSVSDNPRPRLNLVIPTVSPKIAFGGIITGLDVFFEIARRTEADVRVMIDDFGANVDRSVVDKRARGAGLDPAKVEVVARTAQTPLVDLRAEDVFVSFNWWTTLNLRPLIEEQARRFHAAPKPYIYLIQEYEPHFYPFSSTHMLARLAYQSPTPCWGVLNSSQLRDFFVSQGHELTRTFVFEPKITDALRAALVGPPPVKARRIIVYGRPTIERNCYPAVEKGLRAWAERYPEFAGWEVVSAGLPHAPMPLAGGRVMRSVGKLSLEDYADLLRTSAVGLSLMASPHPSYPPLEMAHFGIVTVTNGYANKDLGRVHDNIVSIADIQANTVAEALAGACRAFEADPGAGWRATSHMPQFLEPGPFPCLDEVADALKETVWKPQS